MSTAGGTDPYTSLVTRIGFFVETASVSSVRFHETVEAELDADPSDLVLVDPYYAYTPVGTDARNLYESGAALNGLRVLVCRDGASLIINNHFNQTGDGKPAEPVRVPLGKRSRIRRV